MMIAMKFVVAAMSVFLVAASDRGAPVRHRRLDKRKIMENAIRVNSKGERHLNQDFELTAGYSIQFNHCVSLKTEPANDDIMFAEDLIAYTAKGMIVSQKSFILFNVCETKFCDYYSDDDNLFMVDIDIYMASITDIYQERQENYCTACRTSGSFCGYLGYNGNGNNQYDANSYYWEYMASSNNGQTSNSQNYKYGSQYYGYGYWDQANNFNPYTKENYQSYQKYQQSQEYKAGANENYSFANQYYGYGYWNRNKNQQNNNQNSNQNYQQQGQQQQYNSGSQENYAYGYQDYSYGNNHGGRMLLQGYKKVDCNTCEDFQCFAGQEKATEEEMAAYQQQQYANWQAAKAEEEAREDEDQEDNVDGQEEQDANGEGRRAEEGAEEEAGEQEDNGDQYQYYIAEWVSSVAACKDTGALLDETWPLYAGFMCNEDGSGVDIGIFLDEYCSIYTTRESFAKVADEDDQAYMYEASGLITYTFLNEIDCNADLTYLSFQEYMEMQQTYQYDQNAAYEYGEASEYCQGLFEGGAVSLRDCNQDGADDEVDENAEVDIYTYDYYWYTYVLSYADSADTAATCSVIQNMQGEYTPVYSWKQSGQLYNYGTGLSKWDTSGIRSYFGDSDKMGKALVAAIVLSVMFALFSCFCVLRSCCGSGTKNLRSRKQILEEEDPKKRELIDSSTGNVLQ